MSEGDEGPDSTETETAQGSLSSIIDDLFRDDVIQVTAGLSPRERDVLRLRLGLNDGRKRTLAEVSTLLGVTSKRVRAIEASAVRKLTHSGSQPKTPRSRRTPLRDGSNRNDRPSLKIVHPEDPPET